ncbi:hypothetical protein ACFRR6_02700 [Streptomyces sp. NPDC056891]|uniref:hypothetical protein n=1 Tax=Streptomyces sp. NPDC056891 TaxID=3345961 RepID=UPI0036D0ABF4
MQLRVEPCLIEPPLGGGDEVWVDVDAHELVLTEAVCRERWPIAWRLPAKNNSTSAVAAAHPCLAEDAAALTPDIIARSPTPFPT